MWQFSYNIFLSKMLAASSICSSYIEVIFSMLPLYEVTPAISGLGFGWKTEKIIYTVVTSRKPFVFKIAVLTAMNGTLLPCFLGCVWRCILVGITLVHYQKYHEKTGQKGKKAKMSVDSVKHTQDLNCYSTRALTWCLHGYCSKMASDLTWKTGTC